MPRARAARSLALAAPARAADPTLETRLERALRVPHVDPARTAALAVDLRTGAGRLRAQPDARARPRLEPEAPGRVRRAGAARPRLPLPHRGRRQRHARRRRLARRPLAARLRRPDARAGRSRRARARGRRLGDPARRRRRGRGRVVVRRPPHRGRAGEPSFYINESPPLSALVVDRGRLPRPDVGEPRARGGVALPAGARGGRRARRRAHAQRRRSRPRGCRSRATSPSRSRTIVRFMGRESDNFTAEMLVKQLGALYAGRGSTAAGARVIAATLGAAGVPLAGVRLADGSGLSGLDRLTAAASSRCSRPGSPSRRAARRVPRTRSRSRASTGRSRTGWSARPARGQVIAKTGTTRTRLGALRLRPRPLRLRDPPERPPDLDLLGADRAGPVRDRASGSG